MKIIILILVCLNGAMASTHDWVSVDVKVKSHHGIDETMKLKIQKSGKEVRLMVNEIMVPETRILTNRQDLDTIVNFTQNSETVPCGRDTYSYTKMAEGKSTTFEGCPADKRFQELRTAFRNISAIR